MTEQDQPTDITADDAEGHMRHVHGGTAPDDVQGRMQPGTDDDTQGHVCPRIVGDDDDDVRGDHYRS